MITPNLFIVGFQKCASSTLFDLLCAHPEISGTTPKETFFLTDKGYDNYNHLYNLDNLKSGWNSYINEGNNYILEGSVCNFYQKTALDYIQNLENAKVIFILRDPIERFKSVYKYKHARVNGIPAKMSLEEFYDDVEKGKFNHEMLKYAIEHGKYYQFISKWKKNLGAKKVLVVGMKKLVKEGDQTMREIYNFLDIPFHPVHIISHKNKSTTSKAPKLHEKLVALFGGSLLSNKWSIILYKKLFMKDASNPEIPNEIETSLRVTYQKEYEEYGSLF